MTSAAESGDPDGSSARGGRITKVVLADDDTRFRGYLRALLARLDAFELVGEASDGEETVRLARDLEPDLMLVDIVMPRLNGIAATRRARADRPDLDVVVISLHGDPRFVQDALQAGASAYILKDEVTRDLAPALAAVARGEVFLSPGLESD